MLDLPPKLDIRTFGDENHPDAQAGRVNHVPSDNGQEKDFRK